MSSDKREKRKRCIPIRIIRAILREAVPVVGVNIDNFERIVDEGRKYYKSGNRKASNNERTLSILFTREQRKKYW